MKYLLILVFSVAITEAQNTISQRESQIVRLRNTLGLVNKVEYSYGDAEGVINYFQNNQETIKRIVKYNDGGSYGSSTCDYFTIDKKLVYFKKLEHAWIGDATGRYSLSELVYYFLKDSSGLRTERSVITYSENLTEENIASLKNTKKDTIQIAPSNYINLIKDFQYLETQNTDIKQDVNTTNKN